MHYFEHAFIDMDGVLCDLAKGVLQAHDRMDLYVPQEYITGRTLGITRDELWAPVIETGAKFWEELEPYPWAHELMEFANKIAREVTILTKPLVLEGTDWHFYETGLCVEGKLRWLQRQLGGAHDVVLTNKKNVASKPGTLLFDDDPDYEAAFLAAGGHQFIWPQPYNRFREYIGREMVSAREWYDKLVQGGAANC